VSHDRSLLRRRGHAVALVAILAAQLAPGGTAQVARAATTSQWYAADLHVHSTVSADARPDLGIIAKNARAAGLNAIFLTDHNQASDFPISSRTANNAFFDVVGHDELNHWTKVGTGVTQVTSPIHTGTAATKFASTGTEQYVWTVRGPNLRPGTGAVTTKLSVYPTSLGAGGSLYVSASFGGDVTIQKAKPGPEGYTVAATGAPVSCKSVVFVWYFGSAPDPARYQPTSTNCSAATIPPVVVKAYPITASQCDKAFTLNTWNTCTLDINAAVATLATADRPLDYLGLSELKVAALGPVTAVVDDFSMSKAVTGTVDSRAGDELAARNALIPQFDDPGGNFRVFPALEEGVGEHAQRFNFGITAAGQYTTFCNGSCNYNKGTSGIAPTEVSGYPAQLNHPGVSGGVTDSAAIGSCSNGLTPACGADVMEVRKRNMSNDWDTILTAGTPLVGTWGSDNHVGTWSGSSMATYLYAPSNGFDDLMQALFEGRTYDAFVGTSTTRMRILLNVGASASEPYPARYPLYVPAGDSVQLHATITNVKSGSLVRWVQNGTIGAGLAPTSGTTYDGNRSVTLTGSSAYARIETGKTATADADGTSQAIMLKPAATGVPSGMTYHVERVTPPAGQPAFTKGMTKGITASSWSGSTLSLTLTDRVGSLAEVRVASANAPTSMTANGAAVAAASSLSAFQAATGVSWFYDGATAYLKAPAETGSDTMRVSFGSGGGGDLTPPSAPGQPAATSVGSTTATIAWTRSTDNVGVVRYDVRRDGTLVGTAPQPASGDPSFADSNLTPSTTYSYVVTAVDAAGNSTASPPGSVTTTAGGGGGGTTTIHPIADAKVDASTPTTNYGTTALRVDGSPVVRSYLKFDTSGVTGTVDSATLRIWATSSQTTGFDVFGVSDSSWTELGITAGNQPESSIASTKTGSSGPVTAGTWKTVDVTPLLPAPGVWSLVVTTTSGTALALSSREDATHPPELVITTH
jgi:Fibronectin type III domain